MSYIQKELALLNAVAVAARELMDIPTSDGSKRITEKRNAARVKLRRALRELEPQG